MVAQRQGMYKAGANAWYEVILVTSPQADVSVTNNSGASPVFILDDVINSGELGGPNPLNQALETLTLSREEADELRAFLAHPTAFPRVPARRIPEGDRSRLDRLR